MQDDPEKQQLANPDRKRASDQVQLDCEVVGKKVDRKGVVVGDAADAGGPQRSPRPAGCRAASRQCLIAGSGRARGGRR